MAHIQKRRRSSGKVTYRARYLDDEGEERSRSFDRERDAERWLDGIRGDLARGTYIDPDAGRQPLGDFADVEWAPAQDWKGSTQDAWLAVRGRLERVGLAAMPIGSIDQLTLKAVRQRLRAEYAHSTTNNTMGWISMILRAAHVNGRIARNPAEGLAPLRARAGEPDGKVRPEDVPTTDEALAILAGAPVPYRAAIVLGLAGLRKGEVLGLSADRIDIDARLVTIDRQLQRVHNRVVLTTPKREKNRTIEVPPAVAFEVRRHLRDHHDPTRLFDGTALLFQGRVGTTPMMGPHDFYQRAWRPALRAAGLEADRFKFHSLRHFCASSLLAGGADVATVAGHLGDTVETVSRTYVHWLRDNRHVPRAILERVLAPEQTEAEAR